ncbi:MAG: hypothetical protein FIA92_11875 [Chloroflexi bacterium]|nr:hypothetical protein [Chloroflexota bacterium]
MQVARLTFAALAWLYLGLVAFQVFLAGAGVFGAASFEIHVGVGYLAAFIGPIILLVAAIVARGERLVGLSAAVLVLGVVQSILPWLRADAPFLAALHPVNALLIAWLALVIATRATALVRAGAGARVEAATAARITEA